MSTPSFDHADHRAARIHYFGFCLITAGVIAVWFRLLSPIGWSDTGLLEYYYHPAVLLKTLTTPWNGYAGLGNPSAQNVAMLPIVAAFAAGRALTLSYGALQAALFYTLLFLTQALQYQLYCRLLPETTTRRHAAFAGAIFGTFSLLPAENYWLFGNDSIFLPPLLFGVALIAVSLDRWSIHRLAVYTVTLVLGCLPAFSNPAYILPALALDAALALTAARTGRAMLTILKRGLYVATLAAAGLAWFLLPFSAQASTLYASASLEESSQHALALSSANTSIPSLLSFLPLRTTAPAWAPYWAPQWRTVYSSPLMLTALALLWIILGTGLLFGRPRFLITFGTLALGLGVLLCAGTASPLGALYLLAFRNIPFFALFRDPVNKFLPLVLLGTTLLFTTGTQVLLDLSKQHSLVLGFPGRPGAGVALTRYLQVTVNQLLLLGVIVALTLAYSWPFVNGSLVHERVRLAGSTLSNSNRVPKVVIQAAAILQRDVSGGRVLVLPLSPTGYRWLRWRQGYTGPDLSWLLFEEPTLSATAGQLGPAGTVVSQLGGLSPLQQLLLARRLGVSTVVIERNVEFVGPSLGDTGGNALAEYTPALRALGATRVFSRSTLSMYKLPGAAPLFGASGASLTAPQLSAALGEHTSLHLTLPQRSRGALLTLNEAFSNGWSATVTRVRAAVPAAVCTGSQGNVLQHRLVDGYGNAWVIPKTYAGCETTISVAYSGLALLRDGLALTLLTSVVWPLLEILAWLARAHYKSDRRYHV